MAQVRTNVQLVRQRPLRQPTGGAAQDLSLPSANFQRDAFIRSVPESAAPAAPAPSVARPASAPTAAMPNYRLLSYKTQAAVPAPTVPAPVAPPSPRATVAPVVPVVPAAPVTPAVASVPVVPTPPPVVVQVPVTPPASVPVAPAPVPAPAPGLALPASFAAMVDETIRTANSDDAAYQAAMALLFQQLERRHHMPAQEPVFNDFSPAEPAPAPETPEQPEAPKPEKPKPAKPPRDTSNDSQAIERLKNLAPQELARLGKENKKEFFAILRPAAEEAERKYGVPAAITLAQAALETGWGQHIIPGYNIFGIKGTGPAGTVRKGTWEVYGGKTVTITANFAKYHNFYEGVLYHGKLFHNGYYDKAMAQFKKDKDPFAFARNITGTYATDPAYGSKLSSIMRDYDLV